jgi:putative redox protein
MVFTGYNNDYSVSLDTTRDSGGHDAGISPMNLMLVSVAGCMAMDVISILRKKQQQITGFEAHIEGIRAEEHPKVWTEIWLKFIVTGHNIDPEAVDRSIELSRDKYCGAAATLSHTATIHYDREIIQVEEPSA